MAHWSWPRSMKRGRCLGSRPFQLQKAGYAAKLNYALHGGAWTLCHRKAEISAQKLLDLSKGSGDGQGPQAAVKLLVNTVRKACEGVAPLLKKQTGLRGLLLWAWPQTTWRANSRLHPKKGERIWEDAIFVSRTYKAQHGLAGVFLAEEQWCYASAAEGDLGSGWKRIWLEQSSWGNDDTAGWRSQQLANGWSKGLHKLIGIDSQRMSIRRGGRGSHGWIVWCWRWDLWWVSAWHLGNWGNIWWRWHLQGLGRVEQSLEVLVVDSMSTEELEVFALESQKLARSASHYAQKRKMVQKGKTNRGYNPNAISHNRTAVSMDGKLTLNSGQLQDTLAQVKAKTSCHACNLYGHWQGDKECQKGGAKAKGKGIKERRGGFLQRAGVAAAMIITGVTGAMVCDQPPVPTDVFMVDMPGSAQVFANYSNDELIPPGYAVIDLAALLGCAGDGALDQFLHTFGGKDVRTDETRTFGGVNSAAPIISREAQQLSIRLAGRDARVALHRLSNSRVPISFCLPQLHALGAVFNLEGPSVVFSKVCNKPIPLKYSKTGHLMMDISNWSKSAKRKETVIDTKHIEVFPVITADTTQSEKRVLRSKERKKIQRMADEAKAHGKAVWKVLRGDQEAEDDILVKELYSGRGGGAVTLQAKAAGIPVGRPRDLIFPCDPWSSLSNFKNLDQKEWEKIEALKHLEFIRRVCLSQLRRGRHFLIENPLASQAWKIFVRWLCELPHHSISMHQCQFELKDHNDDYILKPTRLASSSPMMATEIAVKCKDNHTHAEVQGRGQGVSSSLAEWTPEMR